MIHCRLETKTNKKAVIRIEIYSCIARFSLR